MLPAQDVSRPGRGRVCAIPDTRPRFRGDGGAGPWRWRQRTVPIGVPARRETSSCTSYGNRSSAADGHGQPLRGHGCYGVRGSGYGGVTTSYGSGTRLSSTYLIRPPRSTEYISPANPIAFLRSPEASCIRSFICSFPIPWFRAATRQTAIASRPAVLLLSWTSRSLLHAPLLSFSSCSSAPSSPPLHCISHRSPTDDSRVDQRAT